MTDGLGVGLEPGPEPGHWWRRPPWPRTLAVLKFLVGLGLAAVALIVVLGQKGELADASDYLAHLRSGWVAVAAASELAAIVAFAGLQGRLLRSGRVRPGMVALTGITLAGNSINNSLPAGPAFASLFAFRQFRRRGADDALAGWTIFATTVLAGLALALLAAVGLAASGPEAGANLIGVAGAILGALALAVAVTVLLPRPGPVRVVVDLTVRLTQLVARWPKEDRAGVVDQAMARLVSVSPTPGSLAAALGWALGNWCLDCGCLVAAFLAVGAPVPWRGLLLAYGAGQLAANLPITPGGLGVVEGSLTIALVAFGGAKSSTVAAVLLYRIVSFWASLPVGWATWGAFMALARRQDRREAPADPVRSDSVGEVVA
ncbi:MAG: lysylphosphatidylglycerol synthase transmembrane domain-containing protein [Acidimicrobiales bacterium]